MSSRRFAWLAGWMALGLMGAGVAPAGEVLSQGFDDPTVFAADSPIGRARQAGKGSWASNNLGAGEIRQPTVSVEQARSKPHAVKLVRGEDGSKTAGLIGSSNAPAVEGVVTLEYWVYVEPGGSFVSPLTNRSRLAVMGVPAVYLVPDGTLRAWDSTAADGAGRYQPTTAKLAPSQWHGIRLKADPKTATYDVLVNSGQDWAEAARGVPFKTDAFKDINTVAFVPQAGSFYVDDIRIDDAAPGEAAPGGASSPATQPGASRRIYRETFDHGAGGWCGYDGKGVAALELRDGAAISRSPWWVDYNHAPPGGGYLHILYCLYTVSPTAASAVAGPNRFVAGNYATDFTNARLTFRLRGELDAKGAQLVVLAQSRVGDKSINSVLTGQPIRITPDWSEQTVTLVPDDTQWTCLGSRHDRFETYGWEKIAPVLNDLNLDLILVLFPLDVVPIGPIEGDPHRLRAGHNYPIDTSRLPSGYVMLDDVKIEFQ